MLRTWIFLAILSIPQMLLANNINEEEFYTITLKSSQNIRTLTSDVLELVTTIPDGSTLKIPKKDSSVYYNYRDSNGKILRSSTGLYSGVILLSVDAKDSKNFPPEKINELNKLKTGLFITQSVLQDYDESGVFKALIPAQVNSDYLTFFNENGKSKTNRNTYFTKRFGKKLNQSLSLDEMSSRNRLKWISVYDEIKNAGNREVESPTKTLYMKLEAANKMTARFEATGETTTEGAWTMAVKSTAVRHGFPNVPCAEFMSEIIRQAYKRAGYDFKEDFNDSNDNYLIWNKSAAVVNLANSLAKAGWVPWELTKYSPPIGSIMMHEIATSPGHTYMIAGDNGRYIVDNGSPAGRDLRNTSKKIIEIMFNGGVFFLPPGIAPVSWK